MKMLERTSRTTVLASTGMRRSDATGSGQYILFQSPLHLPRGTAPAREGAGDRADLIAVGGLAAEEHGILDRTGERARRAAAADGDVRVRPAGEWIGPPVVACPRIELELELAARYCEDIGQRDEAAREPREWFLGAQRLRVGLAPPP